MTEDPLAEIHRLAASIGLFGSGLGNHRHAFLYFNPPKDWTGTLYHFAYTPWRTKDPDTKKVGFFALKFRIRKDGSERLVKKVRFGRRKIAAKRAKQWHDQYYFGKGDDTKKELQQGMVVEIFEDPVTCKKFEGEAKLLQLLNDDALTNMQFWRVEFLKEEGSYYNRWIKKETTSK